MSLFATVFYQGSESPGNGTWSPFRLRPGSRQKFFPRKSGVGGGGQKFDSGSPFRGASLESVWAKDSGLLCRAPKAWHNPFWGPKSPQTTPNPNLSREPGVAPKSPRNSHSIHIKRHTKNHTEFHWVPGNQGRRGIHGISHPRMSENLARISRLQKGAIQQKASKCMSESVKTMFDTSLIQAASTIVFCHFELSSCPRQCFGPLEGAQSTGKTLKFNKKTQQCTY